MVDRPRNPTTWGDSYWSPPLVRELDRRAHAALESTQGNTSSLAQLLHVTDEALQIVASTHVAPHVVREVLMVLYAELDCRELHS